MRGPSGMRRRRRPSGGASPALLLSLLLLLLLLPPICSLAAPLPPAREADRAAMLQFKASVSSDPAGLLSAWIDSSDPCSWPGVSCDAAGREAALDVSGGCGAGAAPRGSGPFWGICPDRPAALAGRLSPAVGRLSELRVLRLPFHGFWGTIPAEIWGLEQLEVLDLEGSSVSGALPPRFPRGLRVLNLAANQISGEIPLFLSECSGLEVVDLSRNRINGSVPAFFGRLLKLRELRLAFNQLQGPVPGEIGNGCTSLQHLDLSGNLLVQEIPRSLGNCSELLSLLLFSNLLEDVLPSEIGRLRKLQVLDVSRNSLSSFVPAELGNCVELSVIVLSNPYDPVIVRKDLSNGEGDDFNYFQGGIPESITSLPKLRVLWMPRSTLEGTIPSKWGCM